ncbi:MAG: tripartite tricarboxylate transporter substrate binding protein [Betaproteobacteria bacterium]|nr:tripartite tricarboxylate transporter substrate binding protein [Betaproteobacteria bacterium]
MLVLPWLASPLALAALCAATLVLGAGSAPVLAQKYPDKPLRLIVPFAPGGGTDVLARFLSAKLSENLGVGLVIENRSGAGGTIGAEVAARAAPDGYAVLFTSASYTFNPSLYAKLGYDPLRDFRPITLVAMVPHLLVVHPSLPVKNVKELIALARKRPGEVFFASGGTGSSVHLAAALFLTTARVEMTHVPYKGGGPAMTGVLSGEASVMFPTMQSVMPLVRTGRLRALAISITTRSPALPEIPTIAEAGVPGYDATGWYGMLAPAGTPEAAIDRLHAGVVKILAAPELKQRLAAEGAIAVGNTPAQFDRFIRDEIGKWAKIIRELKLRVD